MRIKRVPNIDAKHKQQYMAINARCSAYIPTCSRIRNHDPRHAMYSPTSR